MGMHCDTYAADELPFCFRPAPPRRELSEKLLGLQDDMRQIRQQLTQDPKGAQAALDQTIQALWAAHNEAKTLEGYRGR